MTAFRIAARLAEVPEGDVGRGVALAVLAAPASRGAKLAGIPIKELLEAGRK